MYCGSKALPKNKVFGSEKECSRQIRLYGKVKVQNPVYTSIKSDGKPPPYCGGKKTKRSHGSRNECKKQFRRYGLFLIHNKNNIAINNIENKKEKIQKLLKFKKQQMEFKQLMKNVNAAHQRKRKTFKRIIINNIDQKSQFTGKYILKPDSLVKSMNVISLGDTGSRAPVVLLNTHNFGSVVCKITYTFNPDAGKHEIKIYDIINNLVNDNVTPFVMKSITSSSKPISNKNFSQHIQDKLHLTNGLYQVLVTESVPSSNVVSLHDFLKTNHPPLVKVNILFQLIWTLTCFNAIGLRHNDLHFQNILLFKHNRPTNAHRIFKHHDKTFYVPVTNHEVRIFDFDRAAKATKSDKLGKTLKKHYRSAREIHYPYDIFMEGSTSSRINPQYDTFKLMQKYPLSYDFLEFKYSTALTRYEKLDIIRQYQLDKVSVLDYNLLQDSMTYEATKIAGYPNTNDILNRVGKYFTKPPPNSKLVEIYDIQNLYNK